MRMRIAALAGNGVHRLDVIRTMAIEKLVDLGDDVVLANAGFQFLMNEMIGAVDHGGGTIEKRDLVDVLDLARLQHHLLAVLHIEPCFLQFEHHRRLDDIDADRHLVAAGFLNERRDLLGVALHETECGVDGAAQTDQASLAILRLEPRRVELVVHGSRAEIPQDRIVAGASDERPAA